LEIETIKKANQLLIETIQESLQIADQGKKARSEALVQLQERETELRKNVSFCITIYRPAEQVLA